MSSCVTDVDCAAPASWCTEARVCDALHHECGDWPRCRVTPWLTCLPDAQRCVTSEPGAAAFHTTGRPSAWVTALSALAVLTGLVLLTLALAALYVRRRRRAPGPGTALPRSRTFARALRPGADASLELLDS
jgi:hypothetical protein